MPTMPADPPVDQTVDGSVNPEASSPVKTADPQDVDVEITKTGYTELGRPTVLAKCSAKEERKVRFDMADYSHLNIGEVFLWLS